VIHHAFDRERLYFFRKKGRMKEGLWCEEKEVG
jgi:hypothetical protein